MSEIVAAHALAPSWSDETDMRGDDIAMYCDGHPNDDWGSRLVHWLKQRFPYHPIKVLARDLGEPESVIKSWWSGEALPSRPKVQKFIQRFERDGISSFVLGTPSRAEVETIIQEALSNIIRLSDYARDSKMAEASRALSSRVGAEAEPVGRARNGKVK